MKGRRDKTGDKRHRDGTRQVAQQSSGKISVWEDNYHLKEKKLVERLQPPV